MGRLPYILSKFECRFLGGEVCFDRVVDLMFPHELWKRLNYKENKSKCDDQFPFAQNIFQ